MLPVVFEEDLVEHIAELIPLARNPGPVEATILRPIDFTSYFMVKNLKKTAKIGLF